MSAWLDLSGSLSDAVRYNAHSHYSGRLLHLSNKQDECQRPVRSHCRRQFGGIGPLPINQVTKHGLTSDCCVDYACARQFNASNYYAVTCFE